MNALSLGGLALGGLVAAVVSTIAIATAAAQGPRPGTSQTAPGSAAAETVRATYQAPTIVRMLSGGAGIELIASTKNSGLRTHFVNYMAGFAVSAGEKCKLLPDDVVQFLPSLVKEAKESVDRAAKPGEKAQAELSYRSIVYGFGDGKLFVARNACGDEPAKKAMDNIAELFKLILKKG